MAVFWPRFSFPRGVFFAARLRPGFLLQKWFPCQTQKCNYLSLHVRLVLKVQWGLTQFLLQQGTRRFDFAEIVLSFNGIPKHSTLLRGSWHSTFGRSPRILFTTTLGSSSFVRSYSSKSSASLKLSASLPYPHCCRITIPCVCHIFLIAMLSNSLTHHRCLSEDVVHFLRTTCRKSFSDSCIFSVDNHLEWLLPWGVGGCMLQG